MMRARLLVCLVAILAIAGLYRTVQAWTGPAQYYSNTTVTTSNAAIAFGFKARSVMLMNDDATNSAFYTFASNVATAASIEIKAGEKVTYTFSDAEGLGIICSSGTPAVRIVAVR